MKAFRFSLIIILVIALMSGGALATNNLEITTGTQPVSWVVDQSGVPLYGDIDTGDLIQIIHIVNGSIPHPPDKYGNPTGGDVLVDTTFVGQNFLGAQGMFATDESVGIGGTLLSNWNIYVRAWNSTEASSSTYWGTSEVYQVKGTDTNEKWDINGSGNVTAFATSILFDNISPGPPPTFNATREISGDLILTWTPTNQADAAGTLILWKLGSNPSNETDGTILTDAVIPGPVSFRHTGLTSGTKYYYSAFSYDGSHNYSMPAITSETAVDSLPPSVLSHSPTGMFVAMSSDVSLTFDDAMNHANVENSFHMFPAVNVTGHNWSSDSKTVTFVMDDLAQSTWYTVTIDATATDKALNHLVTPEVWTFRTQAGLPPTISNFKIDGWKRYPGDVISPHPMLSASLNDPEHGFGGIASIEISANTFSFMYGTPEIAAIYDYGSGNMNAKFPSILPAGTYTITLTVWDDSGNPTSEAVMNLQVMGGEVKIVGPAVNYPNPFQSGDGTTLAYTLSVDSDVQIYIYSIKGTVIFMKKIDAGQPGGTAGYNEVFWNGLSNFGEEIGNGMYIIKIANGNRVIGTMRIIVQNKP